MNASRRLAVVCLHTCPWQCPGVGNAGGMNVYVRQTATALAAQGWTIDIFTRVHAGISKCIHSAPRVQLIHVPAGPTDARKDDLRRWLEPFVTRILETESGAKGKYRAVLSHYWLSGLAAIRLAERWRTSHLASFHTLALAKQAAFPARDEPPGRAVAERRVVERADHVLAVSEHERGVLTDKYSADPDTISIASPGIDLERFYPQSRQQAREGLGLPPRDRILLAVGRTAPIKGFDVLLEALAQISDPNVTALLVGGTLEGRRHLDMLARANRLQVEHRVRFAGSVEHHVLPAYYAACDACVVPSLYDSFGLVARESIACGRPVIASRVGGLQSIAFCPSNVLVKPGSVGELAGALEKVLGRAPAARSAGSAAPEISSWSTTATAIAAGLEKVA